MGRLNGISCQTLFVNRHHYPSSKLTSTHICSIFITTRLSSVMHVYARFILFRHYKSQFNNNNSNNNNTVNIKTFSLVGAQVSCAGLDIEEQKSSVVCATVLGQNEKKKNS